MIMVKLYYDVISPVKKGLWFGLLIRCINWALAFEYLKRDPKYQCQFLCHLFFWSLQISSIPIYVKFKKSKKKLFKENCPLRTWHKYWHENLDRLVLITYILWTSTEHKPFFRSNNMYYPLLTVTVWFESLLNIKLSRT